MLKSLLDALSERVKNLCLQTNDHIEFGENVTHVLILLKAAVEDENE
jgi:hypothetical protein